MYSFGNFTDPHQLLLLFVLFYHNPGIIHITKNDIDIFFRQVKKNLKGGEAIVLSVP
jgi:hypothetical protein